MRVLGRFEEYLKDGIVRKRSPDPSRARSLAEESWERMGFIHDMLESMGVSDKNANYFRIIEQFDRKDFN